MQDDSFNILFINSFTRSGSTLLGMLLGIHEKIEYLGEVRNVHEYFENDRRCFHGDKLTSCPLWGKVNEQIDLYNTPTKTSSRYMHRAVRNLCLDETICKILQGLLSGAVKGLRREFDVIENISSIYHAAHKVSMAPWLLDSSHRSHQLNILHRKYRHRIRAVFLTRDGRGVTNSVMNRTACTMRSAALRWRQFHEYTRKVHRQIPQSQIYQLRYEDLCASPESECNKILEFMGLQPISTDDYLSNVDISALHFIGGSPTLRDNMNNNISIRLDEKWRSTLSDRDLTLFDQIAGPLNKSFGYT